MISRTLRILALASFMLASVCYSPSLAQVPGGGVGQYGPVTPNDCAEWVGNGLIKDSGGTCGGGGGSGAAILYNSTGSAKTIDALGSASTLTGSESVPIFQGSNPAVKTTTQDIADLAPTAVLSATTNLSSSDILQLHTNPKLLIAAPGTGRAIIVQFVTAIYLFNTTPYSSASTLEFGYAGVTTSAGTGLGTFSDILEQTASQIGTAANAQENFPYEPLTDADDAAVILVNIGGSDPTGGDGTLQVTVTYSIITVP